MGARLAYLDTLKVLLVVGVIAMHTAITRCPVRWSIS